MKFFIPDLRDDPGAAEERWARYLAESPVPLGSRRVYAVTYEHDGDRYEATVGERRRRYRRQTGPRGGYIRNADHVRTPQTTGTMISAIIDDADQQFYVWTYGPPFGEWSNPSSIGRHEIMTIEYFEPGDA